MKTFNLLFITKDHSQQLERSSFYLSKELSKLVHLTLWHENGHIQDILNKIQVKPDFILLNDYKSDYRPFIRGLETLTIPHGIIMHDLHYKLPRRRRLIEKEKPALIFSHYRDAFKKSFPNHADKFVWFPHHVPEELFKDFGLQKDIPMLMAGAMFPHIYPFRNMLFNYYRKDKRFHSIQHPGYRKVRDSNRGYVVGESYARYLNRSKIFFTCDSVYKFPVLKYFEALACHTLLLAPGSKELLDLGFIDNMTYVSINQNNFAQKAEHFLANDAERNRIIRNGYALIKQRHTTAIRAKEMVNTIRRFLQK
ncbi:glycosyltransferase [Fictibacillus nanhaiensis]|uniref:glycosyltransferase n=1 Tax=Fictibacillus nanhaiensis TaxID=742169 RepID=UPI001C972973|nr:glycosyltransferase [Fictibacillus nanhaiensis]MBY6036300.1 glycosyltransferase [Fictibacillus nanhaiensis]